MARNYEYWGTYKGEPASVMFTVSGLNRDGSVEVSCSIGADSPAREFAYEDVDDVVSALDLIEWAHGHGFSWDDVAEANITDLESIISIELRL